MYIKHHNNRNTGQKNPENIDDFWNHPSRSNLDPSHEVEEPRDFMISEHSNDVLVHWQAPEFEIFERDRKWYLIMGLLLAAIVGWAVYTNSPIMAITFILIGVVGYIYAHMEARVLDFMITRDGVVAGREMYAFDNLHSFWIFYEPEGIRVISLHTNSHLLPYVHIPIEHENPVTIREALLKYIPEEKHEPGLVETLERLLRI